jgi:hypothetical protein
MSEETLVWESVSWIGNGLEGFKGDGFMLCGIVRSKNQLELELKCTRVHGLAV